VKEGTLEILRKTLHGAKDYLLPEVTKEDGRQIFNLNIGLKPSEGTMGLGSVLFIDSQEDLLLILGEAERRKCSNTATPDRQESRLPPGSLALCLHEDDVMEQLDPESYQTEAMPAMVLPCIRRSALKDSLLYSGQRIWARSI
jgi:hypothetical protein